MNRDIRKLAKTEWDFRPLIPKRPNPKQRQEMNAAIHYEYARESPSIRKLAADYAGLPEAVRRDVEEQFSLRGAAATRAIFHGHIRASDAVGELGGRKYRGYHGGDQEAAATA